MATVIATRSPGVELSTGRFLAFGEPAVNIDTSNAHNAQLLADGLITVENAGVTPPLDPARFSTPPTVIVGAAQPAATIGNPVVWIQTDSAGRILDVKTIVES